MSTCEEPWGYVKHDESFSKTFWFPYLLLPQYDDPPWFDRVPGRQVVTGTQLRSVLVSLPLAVTRGPGDADVVPPPITHL